MNEIQQLMFNYGKLLIGANIRKADEKAEWGFIYGHCSITF